MGTCDNNRALRQQELESRVSPGLKDRMMAPEIIEDASAPMPTKRLNQERRTNGDAWKAELAKIEKQIAQIVEAIAPYQANARLDTRTQALSLP